MPYIRKLPSGKWQATIRTPDGKRRTRTDPLKKVVETWARDQEADQRRGEWVDPQDGRLTVQQWWDRWSKARDIEVATSRRDTSHWRTHVEPRWGSVRLSAITPIDVEQWVTDMRREKVGPSALQQAFRLLRHMLADATRHKMLKADPTAGLPMPKVPKHVDRFLDRAEYQALMSVLPTDRDRAVVSLMTLCGLRWEEAAGLHTHRVDFARQQPRVVEVLRRDGTVKPMPKSAAGNRLVPMTAGVVDALRPFVAAAGVKALLFPGMDYTNWRRRVFVPAVKKAELDEPLPTPHDCRHTYGSWLAEAGVPPHELRDLMGHSSLRATERYLHAGDMRMQRARVALDM